MPAQTPCPDWCTVDHTTDPPGAGLHAGPPLVSTELRTAVRLWLTDHPASVAGVLLGGDVLSEQEADALASALVTAAARLRADRQAREEVTA